MTMKNAQIVLVAAALMGVARNLLDFNRTGARLIGIR